MLTPVHALIGDGSKVSVVNIDSSAEAEKQPEPNGNYWKMSAVNKKLLFYAAGIFFCYFYYGVIQEKITKSKYGANQEPFTYTQSLVFFQCICNALFAFSFIKATKPAADTTPLYYYAACGFSYIAAMLFSNHALQFVSYPTQVLGKSCKPIPIMILGVLLAQKRYPLAKYLFVSLIVFGVSLFLYKDKKAGNSGGLFQFGFGEALLLGSLLMDGLTGAIQDRIRSSYTARSHSMMMQMNLWSTVYLSVGMMVTGEIVVFSQFVQRYPMILWDLVSFSVASALGQYFIFAMVSEFGPLNCSIVTTTRKFFTILASVIWFQNPMSQRQWLGTLMVFSGLVLDSLFGKPKRKP